MAWKALNENAVNVTKTEHGIRCKDEVWTKRFTGIKQEYTVFVKKILALGRSADYKHLFDKPEFVTKMSEMENGKNSHDLPT